MAWSESTFSPGEKILLANVNKKEAHLQVDDLKPTAGGCVGFKRPTLVENMVNVITKLFNFTGQSGSKSTAQIVPPYMVEEAGLCDKKTIPATPSMPIFETTEDGTGHLTVPLDYDSTVDDVAMTPAGIYVGDMARTERTTTRSVAIRKRRKQPTKGIQSASLGCGESAKGGGKNRKDKKRHNLRMDIANDSLALTMDDCYGYDYREADFEDAISSVPLSQCYLSSSFPPSSIGSVASSFHDALQDALVMEACMQGPFGRGSSPPKNTSGTPSHLDAVPQDASSTPAPTCDDRVNLRKCDIGSDRNGFVVFTDFDVIATPSASPARRRPSRNLCTAFTYVWRRQYSGDEEADDDDDEDEKSGYSSDDVSEDELYTNRRGGEHIDDDDDDDDDDCVVFCADFDDIDDDTNSSSGFEEKKVRFNTKPVVHVMRAWDFAYRQARKGEWEMAARDRERFRNRIADLEAVLGPALQSALRDKIYAERFSGQDTATRKI